MLLRHEQIQIKKDWNRQSSAITVSIRTFEDVHLNSITFKNVQSYTKTISGVDVWQTVDMYISSPSLPERQTLQVDGNVRDLTFKLDYDVEANKTINISMRQVSGYYTITSGVTQSGSSGIVPYPVEKWSGVKTTNTSNMPLFILDYDIYKQGWSRQEGVNDGLPYIRGLPTEYGKFGGEADWVIDEDPIIPEEIKKNDGFPYLRNLPTEYGHFIPFKTSNWYYNGKNCVVYLNGKEVSTFLNGKE